MEDSEPPASEETPRDPLQLTPLRRAARKRGPEPDPDSDEVTDQAIALLRTLFTQSKGGEGADSSATPERSQSLLQAKRLSRTGSAGDGGAAEPETRPEPGVGGAGAGAADVGTPALRVMKPRATRPPREVNRGPWLVWGAVACLALVGGWTVFHGLQSHPAAGSGAETSGRPSATVSPSGEKPASDEALGMADLVLAAMEQGNVARAAELLADAQRRRLPLPGANYQSALLALHDGGFIPATRWLDASVEAGEAVPECLYLRATIAASAGDYRLVAGTFEKAARYAPFNPRYYFYWGEALRRQGKPLEAVERFEHALHCRPSAADADLIGFKLNLARVEAGNDPEFQASLASKLTQEPVSANLLLVAAANEINRATYAAATPYLQRAAQMLPPVVFQSRLRDYYFRLPAQQKEVAAEWAALTPPPPPRAAETPSQEAKRPVVDPATRSLAESDPACW